MQRIASRINFHGIYIKCWEIVCNTKNPGTCQNFYHWLSDVEGWHTTTISSKKEKFISSRTWLKGRIKATDRNHQRYTACFSFCTMLANGSFSAAMEGRRVATRMRVDRGKGSGTKNNKSVPCPQYVHLMKHQRVPFQCKHLLVQEWRSKECFGDDASLHIPV